MEDQLTPREFIVFLFALVSGGVLAAIFWYWKTEAGPVAWLLVGVRGVKGFTSWAIDIMSNILANGRTNQTNGRTNEAFESDQWLDRLKIDRTKTALIELTAYSGWTVSEIRSVLKGESTALGQEIEAARQRLGIVSAGPYHTPIANRPTAAQFQDELEFQPPPR